MTRDDVLDFLRQYRYAVQATVSPSGAPEAAVVGFVVTDRLEIVFDTLIGSRKAQNLRANPRIALVIGGWAEGDERTVQYEGLADFPKGDTLAALRQLYLARFPDAAARQSDPDLVYVRVRPSWLRYSDYDRTPPETQEITFGG